jgi:carboxyl-terminal processing protease
MKKLIILFLLLSTTVFGQTKYEKDFSEFWTDVNENYAYFQQQNIDWNKVKGSYQPLAGEVKNRAEFIKFLENVINELHNGHISLNTNLKTSNRIIPTGSDIFVEKKGDKFFITDVRKNYPSELCGLRAGFQVTKFNGENIDVLLKDFLPKYTKKYNTAMYEYALNMLFAGTHDKERKITVLEKGVEKHYFPDKCERPAQVSKPLEFKILENNVGYIKINNSLGDNDLISAFDSAIEILSKTDKLIIDLTETPSGGNTAVARAMMGRFIDKEMPYQKHEFYETDYKIKRSWVEYVSPRKETYKNELIVMVGHWTGSMGEGIAIGFDGMKRGKIVGTKMAGLIGATSGFRLSETNIGFQIPTERLYHIDGTPREDFVPKYLTENIDDTWEKVKKMFKVKGMQGN